MDVHLSAEDLRGALENDVRTGLSAAEKWLPPVWFYDDAGSEFGSPGPTRKVPATAGARSGGGDIDDEIPF